MGENVLNVGDGNTIKDSTLVFQSGESLEDLLKRVVTDLETDIEEYELPPQVFQTVKDVHDALSACISDDSLRKILETMDCRKNHDNYSKMRSLVSFLVNARLIDSACDLPNADQTSVRLKKENCWLFHTSRADHDPLKLHLARIVKHLGRYPECPVRDGVAFIAKLKANGGMQCDHCVGKNIDQEPIRGIVGDWMEASDRKPLRETSELQDFFADADGRNLILKCGNCIADVQETAKAHNLFDGDF